jgi:arginyl-tRNA synthetase
VITLDLRHAIGRAVADAGFGPAAPDPGLRAGGEPGRYSSSVAFGLAETVKSPAERIAARLAARLEDAESWIAKAEETGRGYVTATVTPEALHGVAGRVIEAGPDCVRSDALAGCVFPRPPGAGAGPGAWETAATRETAATWEEARERLAACLTARLAEAAGATIEKTRVRTREGRHQDQQRGGAGAGGGAGMIRSGEKVSRVVKEEGPAAAVAFAGRDAVRFALARIAPGQSADLDPAKIARHHLDNPAYAVRYAHARAASGVRWAAAADLDLAGPQRPPADPEALALLDALSWLPERVATAARRGRPDEFARSLEHLASAALAALTRPRATAGAGPGNDNETINLARAARTGLAAGLTLLGISAPDRLLGQRRQHSTTDKAAPLTTQHHRQHSVTGTRCPDDTGSPATWCHCPTAPHRHKTLHRHKAHRQRAIEPESIKTRRH